jgi:hypothetical protein
VNEAKLKPVLLKVTASLSCHHHTLLMYSQRLNREAGLWRTLKHPNVHEFLGVVHNMGSLFALVSPYCAKGNIIQHLEDHPESNRLHLVTSIPQFSPSHINFLVRSLA